ncbi:MAG: hypothetical protein KDJ75_04085 [Alphaproteobacteria bacterium]|nr:hypothetical protein [Alphaproteobacteria bacterium]
MKHLIATIWGFVLLGSTQVWAEAVQHEAIVEPDGTIVVQEAATHGADAHHAAASEGLPQFDPTSFPSQIFWLMVAFSILYIFFSRKTLPDISAVIENRQNHIQSDLDKAEELRREAEAVHAAYDDMLQDARDQAAVAFTETDQAIKEKTAERYSVFYEHSAKEIKAMEKSIEKAKAAAMDDMNALAAEIASQAAEKIIGVQTDIKQAKTVVESLQSKQAKAA